MSDFSTGIFTDGSAIPNPGAGGWAAIYVVNNKIINKIGGSEPETTNNRMELLGVIGAYQFLHKDTPMPISIYCDSKYVVDMANVWMYNWHNKGWRRKSGKIENLDLVKRLFDLRMTFQRVELKWVRGHDGTRWNEEADRLANEYRKEWASY